MKIAILGGTGDVGAGLALRIGRDTGHAIRVGSRSHRRAEEAVERYRGTLVASGRDPDLTAAENPAAADGADLVILAVPPDYAPDTAESVDDHIGDDAVLVTPAVHMSRDEDGFHFDPPTEGSVTERVDRVTSDGVSVVGAFHNLPAKRLSDLNAPLDIDTLLVGDDTAAKTHVRELVDDIDGLRPLDGGGLRNAREIEAVTPLLINVAMQNDGLHNLGVRFA